MAKAGDLDRSALDDLAAAIGRMQQAAASE
jgi:hypothetical protein